MAKAELPAIGIREYTFCVDIADRGLKTRDHPNDVIAAAATDIQDQLVKLGLKPIPLSPILFVAAVDPNRAEDDWMLINEIEKLIDQKITPIRIGMRTVGGPIIKPVHPGASTKKI